MLSLPELPYSRNALEPYISERTMTFHYTKHHATYVKNTNQLIQDTPFRDKPLPEIILSAASDSLYTALFNNAAQSWNHAFFWQSLSPNKADHTPSPELAHQIQTDFTDMPTLISSLKQKALSVFGSGWVWLVWDCQEKHLKIITTRNADTPLTQQTLTPLLCLDVWEHAYYLDYQNDRGAFIEKLATHLLNWQFASTQWKG